MIHRFLKRLFGSDKTPANMTLAFRDKKGRAYFKYDDELKIPIQRMDFADVVIKEVESRISNEDLTAFIDNQEKITFSDKKPEEKLRDLSHHLRLLKERTETLPSPDLLMKLAMVFYIREDENPAILDQNVLKEKVRDMLAEQTDLHGFFYQAGLDRYYPLSNISTKNINELLQKAQSLTDKGREAERELSKALS